MDSPRLVWRKSSHSTSQGECVELAPLPPGVAIRDSKNPDGPKIVLAGSAFMNLLTRVKRDEFPN
ncbi:DUF397 domain-containing protein [Actinomadura craniellae]|uniref:DUF397 domain-containing protein n=1 Tax=Actinomadura craniellae TaxID=2231787 RepID=A0A365GV22_9ACTN|nr:DUF397 domain-containing protein [Actinomadura craniellae]RAY10638.1 DUF397 domain-containing protein [Actinomadura craniellae]